MILNLEEQFGDFNVNVEEFIQYLDVIKCIEVLILEEIIIMDLSAQI